MGLKVYNTLMKRKEEFVPLRQGKVGMYVCGVTAYDDCHLGHARAYVAFDIIRRFLEYRGYEVNYIQNFTDVDDKIIVRAREARGKAGEGDLKQLVAEVAEKYAREYFQSMDRLGVKRAACYPRATGHITEMLEIITGLMRKGYAYQVDGEVFFEVGKFKDYGKLSGRSLEDMRAGARVEIDVRKRSPLDFALWKRAKEEEPSWDSPWGKGRPGWHIECSAMSMKYLGETFDIHAGGQDLIFPHHENEIAQSEAYTGKKLANYWLHNGFVTINREKMSKSLGNFFTLRQIFEKFSPPAVRLFLLSTHYRKPIDFSDDKLKAAGRGLERIRNCRREAGRAVTDLSPPPGKSEEIDLYRERFEDAMEDDFNTAGALGVIFDLINQVNSGMSKGDLSLVGEATLALKDFCEILGLDLGTEEETELGEELLALVKEREEARRKKDWTKADALRQELGKKGIIIEDRPGGTGWRRE
jgi:cysteinyl-tRNA synthetase